MLSAAALVVTAINLSTMPACCIVASASVPNMLVSQHMPHHIHNSLAVHLQGIHVLFLKPACSAAGCQLLLPSAYLLLVTAGQQRPAQQQSAHTKSMAYAVGACSDRLPVELCGCCGSQLTHPQLQQVACLTVLRTGCCFLPHQS